VVGVFVFSGGKRLGKASCTGWYFCGPVKDCVERDLEMGWDPPGSPNYRICIPSSEGEEFNSAFSNSA
jgi:hypothetical protein